MSPIKTLTNGIFRENPTFGLVLGMCPTLATTTSAANGMGMGAATTFVLVMSNLVISPFVTVVDFVMQAYVQSLYESLGLFIPLIVVNCIVLGRAEAFASKNGPILSMLDGLGMGIGFTLSLTILGCIREFLGSGSFFGIQVMDFKIGFFTNAAGAFFVYGICIALFVLITNQIDQAKRMKQARQLRVPAGDQPLPPVEKAEETEVK